MFKRCTLRSSKIFQQIFISIGMLEFKIYFANNIYISVFIPMGYKVFASNNLVMNT